MARKIALSASFWNEKPVGDLLHTCEKIYTTQARNYEALVARFGEDRVRIIPDARPGLVKFLMDRETEDHPGTEFVQYGDLYKIHERMVRDSLAGVAEVDK